MILSYILIFFYEMPWTLFWCSLDSPALPKDRCLDVICFLEIPVATYMAEYNFPEYNETLLHIIHLFFTVYSE